MLRQAMRGSKEQAETGVNYTYSDDGETLTYLLDLSTVTDDVASHLPTHAINQVESIWLDASSHDLPKLALELGQVADRFIRQAGLTETPRPALTICVPQTALPPVILHVLETRFEKIQYGVSPAGFLSHEVEALAAPQPEVIFHSTGEKQKEELWGETSHP
jgi:hypothetical protein